MDLHELARRGFLLPHRSHVRVTDPHQLPVRRFDFSFRRGGTDSKNLVKRGAGSHALRAQNIDGGGGGGCGGKGYS